MEDEFCKAKQDWQKANGGEQFPNVHAYDHSAPPRDDYCFWCGRHRTNGTRRRPECEGYSDDDWWNDAIAFGVQVIE